MTDQKLQGIIFDVDGTLVDSNGIHARAWAEAFARFGKQIPLETVRKQIGKGGDLLVPDLLDGREMRRFGDALRDYRKKIFKERYLEQVRPFPGVAAALRRLGEGRRMVLASSADPEEVEHHVKLLGIEELLEGSTSKEDASLSKPSPEIFEAALEKLGTPPGRTLVVGDTPYDVLAAHRASLSIAAVLSGGFDREELSKAEFVIRDVPELADRIDELAAALDA